MRQLLRSSLLCFLALSALSLPAAKAQLPQPPQATPLTGGKVDTSAAATGAIVPPAGTAVALPVDTNGISSSVTVDAILLPPSVADRIFGREIAHHYAVVELILSNHDSKSSLILHSVLLDYSHWLFSNNFQPASDGQADITAFQAQNLPSQVASTESRLVRGNLEDAQYWTFRNAFIRAASLAGTVASAYSFLGSTNYVTGTGVFGNQVVPALATFWPDRTLLQVNRISDFGFQTNHVIAKNSSDVVVAFFPIDRFLIPPLRKIFIESPAVFFVPGEMLIDKKYSKILSNMILSTHVTNAKTPEEAVGLVAKAFGDYEACRAIPKSEPCTTITTEPDAVLLSLMKKVSLNNIRVVVGGITTVDVNAVPATISDIAFDAGSKWIKSTGVVKAVIHGSFLTDATVALTAAKADGTDVSADFGKVSQDKSNSSDTALTFSVPVTSTTDLSSDMTLQFILTKKATDGSTTTTKPYAVALASHPSTLTGVTVINGAMQATWAANTTFTGTIAGALLLGGQPKADNKITCNVDPAAATSTITDTSLPFSCTTTDAIPAKTTVNFTVTRTAPDKSTVTSQKFAYPVTY